jgi:hypothetical protein
LNGDGNSPDSINSGHFEVVFRWTMVSLITAVYSAFLFLAIALYPDRPEANTVVRVIYIFSAWCANFALAALLTSLPLLLRSQHLLHSAPSWAITGAMFALVIAPYLPLVWIWYGKIRRRRSGKENSIL